jgi:hypothetical protein
VSSTGRALGLLRQAGPRLLALAPVVLPLLKDRRTRETLLMAGRDLADRSPGRRLRGRVVATAAVAQGIADDADTPEERAVAEAWVRRAHNLGRSLDMPVSGLPARRAKRQQVTRQLDELQAQMEEHLGTTGTT